MSEGQRVVAGQVIVSDAIAGARAGEDALEAAVREHARLVYRVAYSVLRNHHDAEDATQETFVRVLRYRRKLEGVRDQRTWLARIAWRVAVDRRKKLPDLALDDLGGAVEQLRSELVGADEIAITAEMTGLLARLISGLPSKLRDVVTLSTVQEMSPEDVAAVVSIPESAVRSRLFRARQILKEKLTALLEGKHGT
jgi:RNA polymerase sigma-70 factor (ECF subfamily)